MNILQHFQFLIRLNSKLNQILCCRIKSQNLSAQILQKYFPGKELKK